MSYFNKSEIVNDNVSDCFSCLIALTHEQFVVKNIYLIQKNYEIYITKINLHDERAFCFV